jgi:hypothetical protein
MTPNLAPPPQCSCQEKRVLDHQILHNSTLTHHAQLREVFCVAHLISLVLFLRSTVFGLVVTWSPSIASVTESVMSPIENNFFLKVEVRLIFLKLRPILPCSGILGQPFPMSQHLSNFQTMLQQNTVCRMLSCGNSGPCSVVVTGSGKYWSLCWPLQNFNCET